MDNSDPDTKKINLSCFPAKSHSSNVGKRQIDRCHFRARCFEFNTGSFDNLDEEFVVQLSQKNLFVSTEYIVYKPRLEIVSGDLNACQVLEQLA